MTTKTNLRVALYARVAVRQPYDCDGVARQLAQVRRRIKDDGCTISADACFLDNGYSGATLLRPALERLRARVAQGRIDRLYLLTLDRLTRRCAHAGLLLDEFTQAGVELVVLNGVFSVHELLSEIQS